MLDMFFKMWLMEIMAITETITSFLLSSWLSLGGNDLVLLSVELYKIRRGNSNQNEVIIGKIFFEMELYLAWHYAVLKATFKILLAFWLKSVQQRFLNIIPFDFSFLRAIFELILYVFLVCGGNSFPHFPG